MDYWMRITYLGGADMCLIRMNSRTGNPIDMKIIELLSFANRRPKDTNSSCKIEKTPSAIDMRLV
jgi:hypothetical protein